MFRNGLRRSVVLARGALPSSVSVVGRQSRQFTKAVRPALPQATTSWKALTQVARMYSSEATADAAARPVEDIKPETEAVAFRDIASPVSEKLLRAITQDMGYENMTPVQAKTINPALKGTDIVAQAKTGTGKTLAFLLPVLQRVLAEDPSLENRRSSRDARSDDIRGIVLSPTRELAEQIAVEARRLTKHTGLVVQCAVGGTHKATMLRRTRREGCHLLVATPGRLNDLLQDPHSGIAAPNLASLVLDEADRMLDVGFEDELARITSALPPPEEKIRQTMLVSATIPDNVIRLARSMVRADDFEFVQTIAENESLTHDRVPQHIVRLSGWNDVFPSLFELIDREQAKASEDPSRRPFKAIVYFNTTALVQLSNEVGFHRRRNRLMDTRTYSIHSGLTQMQRTRAADSFRNSFNSVLFSSDVTARGMDFPDVTHVIQIDTPRDRESYIHRLGRTARQDKDGEGWILLPPSSVGPARSMLRGLPVEPNESLECATGTDEAAVRTQVKEIMGAVDGEILTKAFTSIFGGRMDDRRSLVSDMNRWAVDGWGWNEPPAFSQDWARKMNLLNTDINIRSRAPRFRDTDGDNAPAPRRSSSDPFSEMSRHVRRDSPDAGARRSSGFSSRGRRDSFGGSRGGRGGDRGDRRGGFRGGQSRDFDDSRW